ncbi:MAG: sugar phosphate isomerase/epimerase family protein [Spirochaetota bacterium]
MYLTGFTDEAGMDIDTQIRVTKALGWSNIEMRGVFTANLTDISDAEFDIVVEKTKAAGISVNCFGSAIANGGRTVKEGEDEYERAIIEMTRAIPRMHRLGSKMLRGMSFRVPGDGDHIGSEYEKKVFATLNRLAKICEDAGVMYVHENCSGYGNLSYEHSLRMMDAVRSPAFTLVFDTGNPFMTPDRIGKPPYQMQSAWEFYRAVREHVAYVHIKDTAMVKDAAGDVKRTYVFPGEGACEVKRIVADLLSRRYDGGFSMEPHMKPEQMTTPPDFPNEDGKFNLYYEYGKRFMRVMDEVKAESALTPSPGPFPSLTGKRERGAAYFAAGMGECISH